MSMELATFNFRVAVSPGYINAKSIKKWNKKLVL